MTEQQCLLVTNKYLLKFVIPPKIQCQKNVYCVNVVCVQLLIVLLVYYFSLCPTFLCASSHICLPSPAMAQCVQPSQRLCGAHSNSGPKRAAHSWPSPETPMDCQHGCFLLHEEPAALHISEPPEEGVLTLPQHQIGSVHSLQSLHQIQQSPAGAGEGAA